MMKLVLSSLKPGCRGIVSGFCPGDEGLVRRVVEMGIVPGASFVVRHKALLGDPIAIEIRGGLLALGLAEASFIEIDPLA